MGRQSNLISSANTGYNALFKRMSLHRVTTAHRGAFLVTSPYSLCDIMENTYYLIMKLKIQVCKLLLNVFVTYFYISKCYIRLTTIMGRALKNKPKAETVILSVFMELGKEFFLLEKQLVAIT